MIDIMEIVKSLEESGSLIKGVSEKRIVQKRGVSEHVSKHFKC